MNHSIYLSNKQIQIVGYNRSGGKVKVSDTFAVDLPERTIFNGVVTDSARLVDFLRDLAQQHKKVFQSASLTIDSSVIQVKKIAVPDLKKWQYDNIAAEEAKAGAAQQETVFEYSIINPRAKDQYMMLCAIPRNVVSDYLSIFHAAGIHIEHVYVGLEMAVNYVRRQPVLREGVIALNILDDVSMLSIIFENGEYLFSTRTRLVSDPENGYAQSALQSLSSLTKFNQAVRASYYVGAPAGLVEKMREMQPESQVQIARHELMEGSAAQSGAAWHFALFGMFSREDSVDFVPVLKNTRKSQKPKSKRTPVLVAVCIGAAAIYAVMALQTQALVKENARMEEQLHSPLTTELTERAEAADINVLRLGAVNTQMEVLEDQITSSKELNQSIVDWLEQNLNGEVTITALAFDSQTNELELSGTALSQDDSAEYVERIQDHAEFGEIAYSGYNITNDGQYSFTITIDILDGEG